VALSQPQNYFVNEQINTEILLSFYAFMEQYNRVTFGNEV